MRFWVGRFPAMACTCEVQIACDDRHIAEQLALVAANECWRIQDKFSRYQGDSVISVINNATAPITVDAETAALIDYAFQCYQLSDGLFDITSGILCKVWKFDGSDRVPAKEAVADLLPFIGLDKVEWRNPTIQLRPGMELDFGGIGKEYAVDTVLQMMDMQQNLPILVNFGGDIAANRPPSLTRLWHIGVASLENDSSSNSGNATSIIEHSHGGIATSGDTERFLLKDGIRYSHILNPLTGWPIQDAPRSVTVMANTCTDAGVLATMAMLRGAGAEEFLKGEGVSFSCQR